MTNLRVFKIRFINNGELFVSIVLAETIEEAESMLLNDYKEYNVSIQIEDYEEIEEKGVTLTSYN